MLARLVLPVALALAVAASPAEASQSFLYEWGAHGADAGQMSSVSGLDVADDGTVWVADYGNGRAQGFAPDGTPRYSVGRPSNFDQEERDRDGLWIPRDVAVATDDTILVTDTSGEVQRYERGGRLVDIWELPKDANPYPEPWSLTVGRSGVVYVADRESHLVRAFDLSGDQLGVFGAGILDEPSGVAAAPDGRIFVVHRGLPRIHVFGASGSHLYAFEEGMSQQWDAAVASDGSLWVAAGGGAANVSHYSADGGLLERIERPFGSASGNFRHPFGIGISCADRLYVGDMWRDRILAFGDEASGAGACEPPAAAAPAPGEPPPPAPPPGAPALDRDHRAPRLQLQVPARQRLGRRSRVRLRAACDEACALSVQLLQPKGRGRVAVLAATFSDFSPHARRIGLKLGGFPLRRVRQALRRGNGRFLVRVRARDHAGHTANATRRLVLRR